MEDGAPAHFGSASTLRQNVGYAWTLGEMVACTTCGNTIKELFMKIYQVDAFTKELFKGNPAGVCILPVNSNFNDTIIER